MGPALDVITGHRLGMLDVDPARLTGLSLRGRIDATYEAFLARVPYENLSNLRACRARPEDPEAWPRTTDRFLRENRTCGLGGTSFTLAYALRDLLRGVGGNAHCTLGHNLVTEEAHAAVLVFLDEGPLLYDPAMLMRGPVPVHPGGAMRDPLGLVTLKPRGGPTLALCIRSLDAEQDRPIYSFVPMPASPPSFRQAWVASFCRGRAEPLRIACRVGDEIHRYGQRFGVLETLTTRGRQQRRLDGAPVEELHRVFRIDAACLRQWFQGEGG